MTSSYWLWKAPAFLIAAIVALPILILLLQWGGAGAGEREIWLHLLATKLDRLALNTVLLTAGVGLGVTLLGVSLAWLTAVCEFPGRKFFEWALILPQAIPGYVMAFVFLGLMNYAGPVQAAFRHWFGEQAYFPEVQSAVGLMVVLSLVLYPYVYLLARSAFLSQGRSFMDAGRVLGLNSRQAFLRVAVPVARPAIAGGLALALMETLADFGAVSVFNYDTFTTAIYSAWYGLFNLTVAAQLASLLLLFVGLALALERRARGQAHFTQQNGGRNRSAYFLSGTRARAATAYCTLVFGLAFAVPCGQLVFWVVEAGFSELDRRYFSFLAHSLELGLMAALLTVALAMLLAFAKRLPATPLASRCMNISVRLATLGYALPGSVLAVGIMLGFILLDRGLGIISERFLGLALQPLLAGTALALVLAYCCRFLAVAYSPLEAGLEQVVKPSMVDAARSLGAGPARLLWRVHIPLLKPSLLTAFIIVLVDVMKEMPATLIIRPFGWDTLALRIYQMTAEGQWERAALPAITLIMAGLLPVFLLMRAARRP